MVTVSRGIEVTASFTGSGVAPEALRPTAAIGS
jgi:hypothetical protein